MSDSRPMRFKWETTVLRAGLGCGAAYFGVLMAFACYGDINGRNIWPGDERIAADLGINRTTVARYRQRAIEDGWLAVESEANPGARRATSLRLAIPESCPSGQHVSCASGQHDSDGPAESCASGQHVSCASGQHHQPIHQPIKEPIEDSDKEDPWSLAEAGSPFVAELPSQDTAPTLGPDDAPSFDDDAPSFDDDAPVSTGAEVVEGGFADKVKRRQETRAARVSGEAGRPYVPLFATS